MHLKQRNFGLVMQYGYIEDKTGSLILKLEFYVDRI